MIDTQASERFMAAPWLGEIDPDTKRAILNALVEARAPSGAILLAQDQPNDHLSFLIEGTALDRAGSSRDGRREAITTAGGAGGLWLDVILPAAASQLCRSARLRTSGFSRLYHPAHEGVAHGRSAGGRMRWRSPSCGPCPNGST